MFGGIALAFAFYLPEVTPQAGLAERVAVGCVFALMLGASIAAHEFAHALTARARGKSVDSLTLYLFGGSAHVTDRNINAGDEIAIGIAGPLASAGVATMFIAAGFALMQSSRPAGGLVLEVGFANAVLAIFNALPGFPMDGGRVLRGILWKASGNAVTATKRASTTGRIIAYIVVAMGPLLIVKGQVAIGLWVAATGWLLATLSQSYYRAMLLKVALDGLKVRDLCARDLPVLQTSDTVATVAGYFGGGAVSRTLPVLFGERVAGVVADVAVAAVDAEHATHANVASIMTRAFDLPNLAPELDAAVLPALLTASPVGAAIVEEDGVFIGIVRREDVNRFVDMVEELGLGAAAQKGLRSLVRRHISRENL